MQPGDGLLARIQAPHELIGAHEHPAWGFGDGDAGVAAGRRQRQHERVVVHPVELGGRQLTVGREGDDARSRSVPRRLGIGRGRQFADQE